MSSANRRPLLNVGDDRPSPHDMLAINSHLPCIAVHGLSPRSSGAACPSNARCTLRSGLTLIECLVSIAITGVAAAALLLGIETSLKTSQSIVESSIALGLAEQLMDEIALCRYHDPDEEWDQPNLGPEPGESAQGRSAWDDIDDFHGLVDSPPTDLWGNPLGTDSGEPEQRAPAFIPQTDLLANMTRTVTVQYVDPDDLDTPLSPGLTSPQRLVTVRVLITYPNGTQRELAHLNRSFAYVP